MTTSWLLLGLGVVSLWFTKQAHRPVPIPKIRFVASFFAGWLTNELVVHHMFWQLLAVVVLIAQGGLDGWPGWVGLGLMSIQWALFPVIIKNALRTGPAFEAALRQSLGPDYRVQLPGDQEALDKVRWRSLIIPRPGKREVEHRGRHVFARIAGWELKLDVYAPRGESDTKRPIVLYVPGGGWILGFRDRQGHPMMQEMASRGWVAMNPGYRLSPWARFPDHLVDVKRAIAWIREHADEFGADPDFVAVIGNSAGGHLAALAGLTDRNLDLQPGFEDADCTVQACIPLYGVYDFTNRSGTGTPEMAEHLERTVMQATIEEDPEAYALASPIDQVHADAPPFMVVHGTHDSLTSPAEATTFAAALAEVSANPVVDVSLPGAQHAFDIFPSPRSATAVRGMARFLEHARARQLEQDNAA